MSSRNVAIRKDVYDALTKGASPQESFTKLFLRLMSQQAPIEQTVGAWGRFDRRRAGRLLQSFRGGSPRGSTMKGLDTPVLLEILEGGPSAAKLLNRLSGEELCTTEANFFELEAIARSGARAALEKRLAALARLRRGMTVSRSMSGPRGPRGPVERRRPGPTAEPGSFRRPGGERLHRVVDLPAAQRPEGPWETPHCQST